MNRAQGFLVALALGGVAAAGTFAVARTTSVGSASPAKATVADARIAAMTRQLARQEKRLRRAIAKRPPKLPAIPVLHRRVVTAPAASAAAAAQQRVIYVRPKPIVIHRARQGGEHEPGDGQTHAQAGGGDD